MRFALIDNKKTEAESGLSGFCPGCLQAVIAKCGNQRIHHWAHRSNKMCDSWWEPETEWHRSWKNYFPADWQEVFFIDKSTSEKHIADVRSEHGLVIEFQHSHINPQERIIREKFYKNMVWVVDGTRLKRDYPRFLKGQKDSFKYTDIKNSFFVDYPDECFPSEWIESLVPVIFDFKGITIPTEPLDIMKETLWCLLPGRVGRYAILLTILRDDFLNLILINPYLFPMPAHKIVDLFATNHRKQQKSQENQRRRIRRSFRF